MSYDRFIRYLDWMRSIDLVKKELDGGRVELISLSGKGINLLGLESMSQLEFICSYMDFSSHYRVSKDGR